MLEQATTFIQQHWRDGVTILIIWLAIYNGFVYFRATRGARIFIGLVVIWIALTLASEFLKLEVIGWLLKSFSVFLIVALVVIFQPELRRALAELGSSRLFSFDGGSREFTDDLTEIVVSLAKKRVGALIAIQRGIDLKPYMDTGVELGCKISQEIMQTIFHPNTALHDGGVIVRLHDERILAAGCVFPLNQGETADRSIGLRHRAAMGITDESDAIAIVVSEETGQISIATEGTLERNLKPDVLKERLNELLFADHSDDEEDEEKAKSHS